MQDLEKLKALREPFKPHQISKLPKPTKRQTELVKQDYKQGIRCEICGGWHHPDVIHLDYVGHAALTDRLLDVDPAWSWKPMATNEGIPAIDRIGGMWIELTVCGVTRLGYGSADGKTGGDAIKEVIGDALRNAAMRFGCALDLWHKGDLHQDDTDSMDNSQKAEKPHPNSKQAKEAKKLAREQNKTVIYIANAIANNDLSSALEAYNEMSREEVNLNWKLFNSKEQKIIRDILNSTVQYKGTQE